MLANAIELRTRGFTRTGTSGCSESSYWRHDKIKVRLSGHWGTKQGGVTFLLGGGDYGDLLDDFLKAETPAKRKVARMAIECRTGQLWREVLKLQREESTAKYRASQSNAGR